MVDSGRSGLMEDSSVEISTAGQKLRVSLLVGDFSTATVLSHSGAQTALPMGVAPEIKLNCSQLRLNSIFLQLKSPLPMGVKKRLKLSESQLALLDLLCTRPVWLTDLRFAQLVELTVFLFPLEWTYRVYSALKAY